MPQLLHIRLVFDPKVVKERWVDKWMWSLEGVVTFLLSLIKVASSGKKDSTDHGLHHQGPASQLYWRPNESADFSFPDGALVFQWD